MRKREKELEQYEACTMPIQLLKSDVKFYDWLGMTWNKNNYICKDRLEEKIGKILQIWNDKIQLTKAMCVRLRWCVHYSNYEWLSAFGAQMVPIQREKISIA